MCLFELEEAHHQVEDTVDVLEGEFVVEQPEVLAAPVFHSVNSLMHEQLRR